MFPESKISKDEITYLICDAYAYHRLFGEVREVELSISTWGQIFIHVDMQKIESYKHHSILEN